MTAYAELQAETPPVWPHGGRVPGQPRPPAHHHPQDGSFHLEPAGSSVHTDRVIIDGRTAGLLAAFLDQIPRVWVALRWDGELAQSESLAAAVEFLGDNPNPQALLPGTLPGWRQQ